MASSPSTERRSRTRAFTMLAMVASVSVVLVWLKLGVIVAVGPALAAIGFGIVAAMEGNQWRRALAVVCILVGLAPLVVVVLALVVLVPDLE
jgi:thiol:disulfide interchange protein